MTLLTAFLQWSMPGNLSFWSLQCIACEAAFTNCLDISVGTEYRCNWVLHKYYASTLLSSLAPSPFLGPIQGAGVSRSMQCGTHWGHAVIASAHTQPATELSFVVPLQSCQNLVNVSWTGNRVHTEAITCLLYHMPDVTPMIQSKHILSMRAGCCALPLWQSRQCAMGTKCNGDAEAMQKKWSNPGTQSEMHSSRI